MRISDWSSDVCSSDLLAVGAAMLIPLCAFAAPETDTVVVTATRLPESSFEVPASIDVISGDRFRNDTLAVNLSEGLSGVAGLSARDRQNYAQDTQIRSEEHTSELQSLMRISYAVFCLKKKNKIQNNKTQ